MSRARHALALSVAVLGMLAALPAPAAVSYISGGTGNAEVQALKREGRSFPLNLIFTEGQQSAYVGHVKVIIEDSAGRVLVDTVSGPILLVRLPSGRYRISAESKGRTMEQTVRIAANGFRRFHFHWRGA